MKNSSVRYVARGAVIAALYVILTLLSSLMGLSSGVIQFRFSEALCILPALMVEAIPGLFVGCILSNLISGSMPLDILFGSLATLIGAVGAYLLRRYKWLCPLPTVLANAIVIPLMLQYVYHFTGAYWYFLLTVIVGETVCAYILGVMLYGLLNKYKHLF